MTPTIVKRRDSLAINTPYNADFVTALKNVIPAHKRAWSKPSWIVALEYEQQAISLVMIYYECMPSIVDRSTDEPDRVTQLIKLEYLGRCKSVDNRPSVASAWVNGGWSVSILETALRAFFEGPKPTNDTAPNYYGMLGIAQDSTSDEIKKAYRRMARQWHPDVNRGDPDAPDMFKKINEANTVLSDARKRKKYDFILRVVADTTTDKTTSSYLQDLIDSYNDRYGYRSPLRCGHLNVEGSLVFGKLTVDKINSWEDIRDDQGRTMVTTWIKDDKNFTVYWI